MEEKLQKANENSIDPKRKCVQFTIFPQIKKPKINVINVENLFLTSILQNVFFVLLVPNNGRSSC
jgi:hypothetical protein